MKSNCLCFLLFSFLSTTYSISAQSIPFSQFYASPLYTNPAKAGTDFLDEQQTARFGLQYRNQRQGLYKTLNLSYDQKIDKLHGAIGFNFNSDRQGYSADYVVNRYEFNYALHSVLSQKHNLHLNTSVSAGLGARTINGYLLTSPTGTPETTSSTKTFPLLNTGILLYGNRFYFGVAIQNLNQPAISSFAGDYYSFNSKVTVHAGYTFTSENKWKLIPQIIASKQNKTDYLITGFMANFNNIYLGGWYHNYSSQYSTYEAITGSLGYQYRNFKFTYSYDNPVSSSRSTKNNAHEVSLIYSLKSKKSAVAKCKALY